MKSILPIVWTTLYALAALSGRDFERVLESKKLSRHMPAKTINEIVPKKKKEDRARKARAVIDISDMDDTKKRDLLKELKRLEKDFGFRLKLSDGLQISGA